MIKINEEEYNYILMKSVHTGSQVFGWATENSDYDYVMLFDDFKKKFELEKFKLETDYLKFEEYKKDPSNFASVRYEYDNKNINIIVVTNKKLLVAWEIATDFFKNSKHSSIISKQESKKLFFEVIKLSCMKMLLNKEPRKPYEIEMEN